MMQTMFQPMMDVEKVTADDERFRLKATGGGFLAKMLGMGTKATVTADASGFRLQKSTFGQEENIFVPRSHIASTLYIVSKPLEFLVLGLVTLPLFGLGLVFILVYFLSKKRIVIGVVSSGGTVESVKLKANTDTLDDVREGMKLLEELIRPVRAERNDSDSKTVSDDAQTRPAAPSPSRGKALPLPPSTVAETIDADCPGCGARISLPATSVGKRVRCPSCREVFTASGG